MAIAEPELGSIMHSLGVVLRGHLPDARWIELLQAVAKGIGMAAVDEPKVWTYPTDGKGGTGQTIVLPITESFLVLDTWRDHSGAYLFVCSCRGFFSKDVDVVVEQFGLKPALNGGGRFYAELNLK